MDIVEHKLEYGGYIDGNIHIYIWMEDILYNGNGGMEMETLSVGRQTWNPKDDELEMYKSYMETFLIIDFTLHVALIAIISGYFQNKV